MLTRDAWHKYIKDNILLLEVKEIPSNAHKVFVKNSHEWGINTELENYIINGEIYHEYEIKIDINNPEEVPNVIIIKWDKYLLETILNGECEYFQEEALEAFKKMYFKFKFEEEICSNK